jgi:uncharacterized protein HemX
MNDAGKDTNKRNREIAHNESVRQTTSDVRVSVWAIAIAVIVALALGGWLWLGRQH